MSSPISSKMQTHKEWLRTRCRLERAELCVHLQEAKAQGPLLGALLRGTLLRHAKAGAGWLPLLPILTWLIKTWLMPGRGGAPWWSKGVLSCLIALQVAKRCWSKHPRICVGLASVFAIVGVAIWKQRR